MQGDIGRRPSGVHPLGNMLLIGLEHDQRGNTRPDHPCVRAEKDCKGYVSSTATVGPRLSCALQTKLVHLLNMIVRPYVLTYSLSSYHTGRRRIANISYVRGVLVNQAERAQAPSRKGPTPSLPKRTLHGLPRVPH